MVAPTCTLPYAPPELITAACDGTGVQASGAHDVWALGVIAYEAIVQGQALQTQQSILDCADGRAAYPWELPTEQQPVAWRKSKLRSLVAPCLARSADARPHASDVLAAAHRFGQATTMH